MKLVTVEHVESDLAHFSPKAREEEYENFGRITGCVLPFSDQLDIEQGDILVRRHYTDDRKPRKRSRLSN